LKTQHQITAGITNNVNLYKNKITSASLSQIKKVMYSLLLFSRVLVKIY